jgi:hypothetical protein
MPRKYETIWLKIKEAGEGQWVDVRFSNPGQLQTIINMVSLEKSKAQKNRKDLGMPRFGKLQIDRRPEKNMVRFTLINSGDSL